MHRALDILEIVRLICRFALRKSLPALARTCRAFCDPALDVLWRDQRSLRNLVKCMPDGLWDFSNDGEVSLLRPIVAVDWDRFLFYSSRVKSFRFFMPRHHTPFLLDTLRLSFPGPLLLPNLTSLSWTSFESNDLRHMRLFLGPRLIDLQLGVLQSAQHISVLPVVAATCPLLANVNIDTSMYEGPLDGLYALVVDLRRPRTLSLPALDSVALYHLAGKAELTSLSLECRGAIGSLPSTNGDERLFPDLDCLSITAADRDGVISVLPLMRNAPIDCLTIEFTEKSTAATVAACCAAISSSCSIALTTLETLELASGSADEELGPAGPEPYTIRNTHLHPLLSFANLRILRIDVPHVELDDSAAAEMARAWPHAESLYLGSHSDGHLPARLTLAALLPFAQHCPQLHTLHLPLNAQGAPPKLSSRKRSGGTPKRIQQKSLETLGVKCCPCPDAHAMAVFLSSVFPKLWVIFWTEDCGPEAEASQRQERWQVVEKWLPSFAVSRAEERRWRKAGKD